MAAETAADEPVEPKNEGLRERKKRRTRQHISDVATGLFLARGFDAVTIAEIADVAEVSVNTVYNYFPAKEDLFLDRSAGIVERLSRYVRARDVGESAAAAVLRELRAEVEVVSPRVGLFDGYADFMRVLHDAPTLRARLWYVQQEALQNVVNTLREETGAQAGDPLPLLMGGQIAWLQSTLMAFIGGRMVNGEKANEVSRAALVLLDEIEGVWGDSVLGYAVREG
ncbi:HTH-type transcriptional regulator LuxR [Streptomyces sp. YIM 130001]|uniref:TetR/AcrR family transcriptional regulator n=1 Tax=Streptomyces sp. YIM 130001 TaxID=2259644 RepID=UPI000E6535D2|nr:TetR/AcrR family transcriptional regulator [Streptomyces sp. YIM 130001]RII15747.1 HTH-type transcriptional regulator LuxR [Streptomyces sp. YIM 130001]